MNFYINFTTLLLYLITSLNYTSILCAFNTRSFFFNLSEVILKTNGTGNIAILSYDFYNKYNPNGIYINDILLNENENRYYFTNHENFINKVRITWDISINTTDSMFSGCNKIVEMDLSKFKATDVITMNSMFSGCSSLISVNLFNIDTSKVISMSKMFSGCSSLIFLN